MNLRTNRSEGVWSWAGIDPARLPTELYTERLALRSWHEQDAAELLEAIEESRAELDTWIVWHQALRDRDAAAAWIRSVEHGRYDLTQPFGMAVRDRASGRLLGGAGLKRRRLDATSSAEWLDVGYWVRTTATRRGYAREAARRLVELAFEDLDAARVEIRVEAGNDASIAVPVALGFVKDGVLRRVIDREGVLRDLVIHSMLRADWLARPARTR